MKKLNSLTIALLSTMIVTEALAESLVASGTYEVPVAELELKSAAQFDLKKVLFKQDGTNFEIKYTIPTQLTGEKNMIQFKGVLNAGVGSGVYGENKMDCLIDQTLLMCKVEYRNLKFDQPLAEKLMAANFKGDALIRRLAVQRGFSTDPVGVIKIKLSAKNLVQIQ